jgi:glycosyltransferase involved in cell wall biosynthesis
MRIRVAFCIDNMNVGGTELNAVRTAERLDRCRFDLSVVSLQTEGPLLQRYDSAGIPVAFFPISNPYGPSTARQGLALARFLRRQRVDLFHAHDAYSNVFGVPWARLSGARVIASRRWWAGFPGRAWRLASGVGYRLAHVALANSERVARLLIEEGLPSAKIAVVRNFVDDSAFATPTEAQRRALLESLGLAGASPVIGIVANLSPVKDHASLLRAVAVLAPRWPSLRILLVGADGGCRGALERLAGELGIGRRVVFAGPRPNEPNLHHLFDVSVLCSTSEGLPNSILEAMAAGRPVVATDVGACGDAVLDGETGVLVPPSAPAALADALGRLLSEPGRGRAMGEAGQRRAASNYSAASALGSLESLYEKMTRSESRQSRVLENPSASGLRFG